MKKGRSSIYTDDLAVKILSRISMAESVRRICEDEGMPDIDTIYQWLFKDLNGFAERYARAKQEAMELKSEEIEQIVDSVQKDTASIAKARLQVDTKKWLMSKLAPKKYGEKLVQEIGGIDGKPIQTQTSLQDADRDIIQRYLQQKGAADEGK
jgi:Asp-tRNA(Asn)/Glu-tRNA(Gln) amidotransferase B subunit